MKGRNKRNWQQKLLALVMILAFLFTILPFMLESDAAQAYEIETETDGQTYGYEEGGDTYDGYHFDYAYDCYDYDSVDIDIDGQVDVFVDEYGNVTVYPEYMGFGAMFDGYEFRIMLPPVVYEEDDINLELPCGWDYEIEFDYDFSHYENESHESIALASFAVVGYGDSIACDYGHYDEFDHWHSHECCNDCTDRETNSQEIQYEENEAIMITVTPASDYIGIMPFSAFTMSILNASTVQSWVTSLPTNGSVTGQLTISGSFNTGASVSTININGGRRVNLLGTGTWTRTEGRHFNLNSAVGTSGPSRLYINGGITLTAGRTAPGGANAGGIAVNHGGTLTMNNGTIRNNQALNGGGVNVGTNGSGHFIMNGGTIHGNFANVAGGGVRIVFPDAAAAPNTFRMNGGTIHSNTSVQNGGGVSIGSRSRFYFHGGQIGLPPSGTTFRGNVAGSTGAGPGGGVALMGTAWMEMRNATSIIQNNEARSLANAGGGVFVEGTFHMHGGFIQDNRVTQSVGGGVAVMGNQPDGSAPLAVFDMHNGTIRRNTAQGTLSGGGGVRVNRFGDFIMRNGVIYSNTANSGGGVCVGSLTGAAYTTRNRFIMLGGTIHSNRTTNVPNPSDPVASTGNGGGVAIQGSIAYVRMDAGTIHSNWAYNSGGGIWAGTTARVDFSTAGTKVIRNNYAGRRPNGTRVANGHGGGIAFNSVPIGGITRTGRANVIGTGLVDIHNNNATGGGGGIDMGTANSVLDVRASTNLQIRNNTAGVAGIGTPTNSHGGGINHRSGRTYFAITPMVITGNTALGNGGGINRTSTHQTGNVTLGNAVNISSNTAGVNGGGIFTNIGTYTLGTTAAGRMRVASNTAANGGGIHIAGSGIITIPASVETSIVGNRASAQGAGIDIVGAGRANLNSTAIWIYNNRVTAGTLGGGGINVRGTGTSANPNVIMTAGSIGIAGGTGEAGLNERANHGRYGGGVRVTSGYFRMDGGAIFWNRAVNSAAHGAAATGNGGGLHISGGTFTMNGAVAGARIIHQNHAVNGGGVAITGGTFNMIGANANHIQDNRVSTGVTGAGVHQTGGIVNMTGTDSRIRRHNANGTDTGGTSNGNGVWMSGGTFNMNNATARIYANRTAAATAGGVHVQGTGIFRMYAGFIGGTSRANESNQGAAGGGVRLTGVNARFHMVGAAGNRFVQNNVATSGGGGFLIQDSARLYMTATGGRSAILNNQAAGAGGGIYVITGQVIGTGGGAIEIDNNTASSGGGIFANNAVVNLNNAGVRAIRGNTASTIGGGVSTVGTTVLTLNGSGSGVAITGNTAGTNGGGIHSNATGAATVTGVIGTNSANGAAAGNGGGGVFLNQGAFTFTGYIQGNTVAQTNSGAGVHQMAGTFNMNGASTQVRFHNATGASAGGNSNGSGVDVRGGTFNMNDGWIVANRTGAANRPGGVNVEATGIFNQAAGNIGSSGAGNRGTSGGGVRVAGSGRFNMTGTAAKSVSHNESTGDGGGVYIGGVGAQFNITGAGTATIANNTATGSGGGVHLTTDGVFNVAPEAGINNYIQDNIATLNGGGINQSAANTTTTFAGVIRRNNANGTTLGVEEALQTLVGNGGGGVFINNGTFTFRNGAIENNTAQAHGGGVRIQSLNPTFTMQGGAIRNNNAPNGDGGGIFSSDHDYRNPIPNVNNTYRRFTITGGTVTGNVSRQEFAPPSNHAEFNTRAAMPFNGSLLTNHQINYRGLPEPDLDLTITKTVTGIVVTPNHDFPFTLHLANLGTGTHTFSFVRSGAGIATPIEGTFSVIGTGGSWAFNLRHGQQIVISDLPEAATVRVVEGANSNYNTTIFCNILNGLILLPGSPPYDNKDTGILEMAEDRQLDFTNDRRPPPQTMFYMNATHAGMLIAFATLGGLLAFGGIVLKFRKSKQAAVSKILLEIESD